MIFRNIVLLIVAALLLILSLVFHGVPVVDAICRISDYVICSPCGWSNILRSFIPLLLCGLAIFISFNSSLFNIGCEGQLAMGAVAASASGILLYSYIGIVGSLIISMVAGSLCALIPAWIKAYRGGHEVVTTIMMNSIAINISLALIQDPIKDNFSTSLSTILISEDRLIPSFMAWGVRVSYAIPLLIIFVGILRYLGKRNILTFERRVLGANLVAAEYAGINVKKLTVRILLLSGALAGLAGGLSVFACDGMYYPGLSPGYGYTAIGIGLLAGNNILYVIPSALFFAIITKVTSSLHILGLSPSYHQMILAVIILVVATFRYSRRKF